PFQNVSQVTRVIFNTADKIRMSRTRLGDDTFHLLFFFRSKRFAAHDRRPAFKIIICQLDHYRTAESFTVTDAGTECECILLDFHSAATAVSALPSYQLSLHTVFIYRHV